MIQFETFKRISQIQGTFSFKFRCRLEDYLWLKELDACMTYSKYLELLKLVEFIQKLIEAIFIAERIQLLASFFVLPLPNVAA